MLFFFLNDPAPPKFSPLPLPAPLPVPLGLRNAPATTPAAPVAPGRPGLAPLGPGTAPGAPKPGGTSIKYTPGQRIMVDVKVNGTASANLLLDTGADKTMINPRVLVP